MSGLVSLLQLVAGDSTHLVILLLIIVHLERDKNRQKNVQERLERVEQHLKLLAASKRQNEAASGLSDDLEL